jgi:hypothetical protein
VAASQARKLGIRPGLRVALDEPPAAWSLRDPPDDLALVVEDGTGDGGTGDDGAAGSTTDMIIAFFARARDLPERLPGLAERVYPAGAIWAAWPRRAGGHRSDITDNVIREYASWSARYV